MSEEWGTPISKEKIIDRRNRLIEYQKTQDMRFTVGYQIIDENILDINYMIYEIERLNNIIKEEKELALLNDNQRKFVMEYFKESYEVLGIHNQTTIFDFIGSEKEWIKLNI